MPHVPDDHWPDELELPEAVGAGRFYHEGGEPCCAIGHVQRILPRGLEEWHIWRERYVVGAKRILKKLNPRLYRVYVGLKNPTVEVTNDNFLLYDEQRTLAYAVAWGLCDYQIWNYPEAQTIVEELT